ARSGEVFGSRIITSTSGEVGPLLFRAQKALKGKVHYQSGSSDDFATHSNGSCIVNGGEIAGACRFDGGSRVAAISLNNVSQYYYIELTDDDFVYTVYFAERCQFSTPKSGGVIVPASIPLYRFLFRENAVDLTFKFYNLSSSDDLILYENSSPLCGWVKGRSMNPEICPHLTSDKNTLMSDVTITIKKKGQDFVTYRWGTNADSVAITLDWAQLGISSEVIECQVADDLTSTSNDAL
ncbi:hypothetical protein ACTXT7_017227, partial [Hymenolepis weldensis]